MPGIDVSQVKWDSEPIDTSKVQWDESQGKTKNATTGVVRGFNDVVGTVGNWLSKVTPDLPQYQKQRQQFDQFNAGLDQAAGDSLMYRGGRLGGHILATAPVGGVVAAPLKAAADAGYGASVLGPLADAIATGGLRAGGVGGIPGAAVRTVGGAINGAATAGVIDPNTAGTGAAIGAVLPNAMFGAGKLMHALRSSMSGKEIAPEMAKALKAAQEAGYVVPPTQANPTLFNRALEGLAGKATTAQEAAARNQTVTNDLAAQALGLPKGTTLTPEVLDKLRATAGEAYKDVSKLGAIDVTGKTLPAGVKTTQTGSSLLNNKTSTVDAGDLVQAWRQYSADATAYFRSYGRTADPEMLNKALAASGGKKQIDELLMSAIPELQKKLPQKLITDLAAGKITQDQFLQQTLSLVGKGDMAEALKAARMQIAKSHSVENAMNAATGTVDARKLAAELQKGNPMTGELKQIADFAGRFPKAAQPVEQMGSLPGVSPLDWAAAGSISAGTGPMGLLSLGARPLARSAALSQRIQGGLLGQAPTQPLDPNVVGLLAARLAPVLAVDP